jgi:hypothetical protein
MEWKPKRRCDFCCALTYGGAFVTRSMSRVWKCSTCLTHRPAHHRHETCPSAGRQMMVKLPRTCEICGRSMYHYGRCGCTPAPVTKLDLREHGDNLRRLIDIALELDGDFDRQLYDTLKEEKYENEPEDSEFSVNVSVGLLRRLTIAALAANAIVTATAPASTDSGAES